MMLKGVGLPLARWRLRAKEIPWLKRFLAGLHRISESRRETADVLLSPWAGRVMRLAEEGKPADQIADAIYKEELAAGAWLVDIGMWKGQLEIEVHRTLKELVRSGLLTEDQGG